MKYSLIALPIWMLSLSSCDKIKAQLNSLVDEAERSASPAATAYAGDSVKSLSQAEYDEFTKVSGRLVLVDFYADWCGPCRELSPILDAIVEQQGGLVLLGKVNVDQNKELAAEHGVQGIPDVRIFKDGKEVDRFVGLPPEHVVRERISKQLKGMSLPVDPPTPEPPVAPNPSADTAGQADAIPPEPEAAPVEEPVAKPMQKDWLPPGMQRR